MGQHAAHAGPLNMTDRDMRDGNLEFCFGALITFAPPKPLEFAPGELSHRHLLTYEHGKDHHLNGGLHTENIRGCTLKWLYVE
jgi:hypothetical protein